MSDFARPTGFNDPGLSWSQLRAFDACARLSSFSAAALALSISASAVRFQVGLLEARLGATLFERGGGRLALTRTGATFAQSIARPLEQLLDACAAAAQSVQTEPMTLSAPPLFARQFLLGGNFLKWCDANDVRLDISDAKRDLHGPAQIAAIRLGAANDPDLASVPLFSVTLCIAAAPALAVDARPADPDWWAAQTMLCPSAGTGGWQAAWRSLKVEPQREPRGLPYASYAAAIEAACAGAGLILAPLPFANREIAEQRLRVIAPLDLSAGASYTLIMRKALAASKRGKGLSRMLIRLCAG